MVISHIRVIPEWRSPLFETDHVERTLLSAAFDVDPAAVRISTLAAAPSLSLRSLERQGGEFDLY
jgi:hypothetical protein